MNYENKIIELFDGKYLKTSDVVRAGIPKVYLTKLVKNGIIKRVKNGLYINSQTFPDTMYENLANSKYGIYSSLSALYLLDFSDRIPMIYDVTVPTGYKGYLQKIENVKLYYVSKKIYNLGLVEVDDMFNNKLRCYDLERTICDIVKYYDRLDKEICNKALIDYFSGNYNEKNLFLYAKKIGIYEKLIKKVEVLR